MQAGDDFSGRAVEDDLTVRHKNDALDEAQKLELVRDEHHRSIRPDLALKRL